MKIAHEKLDGIDRNRLLAVVEPVLTAHGVDVIELLWKVSSTGRVLWLTVERPDAVLPGEGVTIDLCSEISRDLSAALDVSGVLAQSYRLEVGSPGLERQLYSLADYRRFVGWMVRVKLAQDVSGQRVLRGRLSEIRQASIIIQAESGPVELDLGQIETGRLVFDWQNPGMRKRAATATVPVRKNPRDGKGRAAQRSK